MVSAYVYLFDTFSRDESQIERVMVQMTNASGVSPKIRSGGISYLGGEMASSASEKMAHWEINNMDTFFRSAEQESVKAGLGGDFGGMRKMIGSANAFGVDNNTMPFYSLTCCMEVNITDVQPERVIRAVETAVHPIRALFDSFGGSSTELVEYRPCAPCLIYLGADYDVGELAEILSKLLELDENDRHGWQQLDRRLAISKELRSLVPLNSLPWNHTLVSGLVRASNVIPFVGSWEQEGLGGLNHPFIFTLAAERDFLRLGGRVPHFSISGFNSYAIYHAIYGPGFLVSIVSFKVWLQYLIMRVRNDERFKQLRARVEQALIDKDRTRLRKDLIDLNGAGSSVVHLRANLGEFHTVVTQHVKPLIEDLESLAYKEVPIIAQSGMYQNNPIPNDKPYIKTMAQLVVARLDELQQMLDERIMEYEKFHTHVANIVNVDMQNAVSKYAKISLFSGFAAAAAGIAAAVAAIILLFKP